MDKTLVPASLHKSPSFIMGVFILLIGPFALNFHFHYPDEMYYTDATIQMLKNDDYLTTYLGNGELRFRKPILTYWTVLAGFKLFGISAFSSRFFFLLAGGGLVGLVYAIGKLASGNKDIASLAAWVTAAQPLVIFSSSRSIPDILFSFFITLGALGITGILKYGNEVSKKYLWMTFLGFGLAFGAKGLPAAALGMLAFAYLVLNPWQKINPKTLVYWPPLLAGFVVAFFWFIAMYIKFGPIYLSSFLEDQVGMRIEDRIVQIISHFLMGCGLMVALFLPWLFFVGGKASYYFKASFRENRPFFGFLLAWLIAILLMIAMVSEFYDRYLLPVYPLVAVGIAWSIVKSNATIIRPMAWWSTALILINMIILVAGIFINIGLDSPEHIYVHWILGMSFFAFLWRQYRKKKFQYAELSMSIMLVFFNGCLVSYPLSIPHQGTQVDELLNDKNIPFDTKIGFIGNPHHSSKIRISLETDHDLINLEEDSLEDINAFDYLICDEKAKNKIIQKESEIELAAVNWDPKYFLRIFESILDGDSSLQKLELSKKYYFVRTRNTVSS